VAATRYGRPMAVDAQVREAQQEDADAIAAVHTRAWQVAYEHVFGAERLGAISVEERAERWQAILAERREREATFVVQHGDVVVGFASVGSSRDTDARAADGELYGIYVTPTAWGTGAGRALLEASLEALRSSGFREATLWVLDDNPRARRVYEKTGWRIDGLQRQGSHLGVETTEVRYRITLGGA
jgi:RimJ/RimL family protein N-acetyltransferase